MTAPTRRRAPAAAPRYGARTIALVGIAVAMSIAVSAAGLWFALTWTILRTPDGEILLLQNKQAEECASGGPCAVFSAREFVRDATLLCRQVPK